MGECAGSTLDAEGGELADEAAVDDADGEGDDFVPIGADYYRWCDCTGHVYTYGNGGGWIWQGRASYPGLERLPLQRVVHLRPV